MGNIIDTPYFAGRKDTRMLQLADYVTYAVHRSYEHGDSGYLDKIMPLFKTTDTYYPDGLYHMTKNEDCDCDACYWRSARQP